MLIGRLAGDAPVPDFNLDADRGYGYHAWEWDRRVGPKVRPDVRAATPPADKYHFLRPCTVPEGYCQNPPDDVDFNPAVHLALHYEPDAGPDGCSPAVPVSSAEVSQAGMPPQGVPKAGARRGR